MKKLIALVLALTMALSLAACNSEGGTTLTDKEALPSIQWLINGTYSFDFTMIIEASGLWRDNSGRFEADAGKFALSGEMAIEGTLQKIRSIHKGGKSYTVYEENKTVLTEVPPNEDDIPAELKTDYSRFIKIGEGTGEFDGRTLSYEEYADSAAGKSARFYLEGGVLCGIETEGSELLLSIKNISNSVPAGIFDWPSDYTEDKYLSYWEIHDTGEPGS